MTGAWGAESMPWPGTGGQGDFTSYIASAGDGQTPSVAGDPDGRLGDGMMTDEDREWPLPPVVYRGSKAIDGEVPTGEDAHGGGETSLPAPFVATGFLPPDTIPVDALPAVPAGPRVDPEEPDADSWTEPFQDRGTPVERSQELTPEAGPLALEAAEAGEAPEVVEASPPAVEAEVEEEEAEVEVEVEEVAQEELVEVTEGSEALEAAPEATAPLASYPSAPLPPVDLGAEAEAPPPALSSPQEDVAILLERLAAEVRARGEMRLDGGSGATPLEGLLRGVLAGYLAHVEKGPG